MQQRVTRVEMVIRITQRRRNVSGQTFSHGRHGRRPSPLCGQACDTNIVVGPVDQFERLVRHRNIEHDPTGRDPITDRDANEPKLAASAGGTGKSRRSLGNNVQIGGRRDQARFECRPELHQSFSQPLQRYGDVDCDLSGNMNKRSTTTADPSHIHLTSGQFFTINQDIGETSFATNRDRRRMLTDQDRPVRVRSGGDFSPKSLLQFHDRMQINRSQQKRIEG